MLLHNKQNRTIDRYTGFKFVHSKLSFQRGITLFYLFPSRAIKQYVMTANFFETNIQSLFQTSSLSQVLLKVSSLVSFRYATNIKHYLAFSSDFRKHGMVKA